MPEFALTLVGLLVGVLVPFGLRLGLAAGQADAAGGSQNLGQARVTLLLAGCLCLAKKLGGLLVLACFEELAHLAPVGPPRSRLVVAASSSPQDSTTKTTQTNRCFMTPCPSFQRFPQT